VTRSPHEPEQSPERRNRLLDIVIRQRQRILELEFRAAGVRLVDLAIGVLSERLGTAPTTAGDQLRLLARTAGVTEADFAAELLGESRPVLATAPVEDGTGRRLWRAVTAAGRATDGDAVARAVLREGLATHAARALVVWTLEPDGALTLVGQHGLTALDVSRWQRVPPQFDCAATRAVAGGQPVWWPDGRPPGGAAGEPRPPGPGAWTGARAALPLLAAGTLVGAVEICWARPTETDPARLLRELVALADVCRRALHLYGDEETGLALAAPEGGRGGEAWLAALLDGLAGSVLLARAARDDQGEIVDFTITYVNRDFVDPIGHSPEHVRGARLLDLYPLMGADDGLFGRAVRVLRTGMPYVADRTVLICLVGDVIVSREMDIRVTRHADSVAISWRFTDGPVAPASLGAHVQRLGGFGGWEEDVGSGAIRWTDNTYDLFHLPRSAPPVPLEDLHPLIHTEDRDAFAHLREALLLLGRPASASFRVLLPGGGQRHWRTFAEPVLDTSGTLVAVRGVYQDLTDQYRTELVLTATRSQLADSEARADNQHQLALALQKAIIPDAPPLLTGSGLAAAVRYRPAEQESLVGGDWYDAVKLPDGRILLAVGDVAGHSIRSVAAMTTLRNSLRGLAVTGAGPGQLVRWLNDVACHFADDLTATVVCGLYEPADRTLRWAHAGHLPPVLIRAGEARTLAAPNGLLLGVLPDVAYEEARVQLTADDVLLLYTDGLVERRRAGLDESLSDLLRLAAVPQADVACRADFLLAHCTPDTDDDTCLVVVELHG
jgi:serine phosphatase RsbU (regulator of sigma subunit)/PAS domain-containing protein